MQSWIKNSIDVALWYAEAAQYLLGKAKHLLIHHFNLPLRKNRFNNMMHVFYILYIEVP